MKDTRYWYGLAAVVIVLTATAMPLAAQSENQSLGDYARTVKKPKSRSSVNASPKVYDNDNLPGDAKISVVGNAGSDASATPKSANQDQAADSSAKTSEKSDGKTSQPQLKPGQSAEERQKAL